MFCIVGLPLGGRALACVMGTSCAHTSINTFALFKGLATYITYNWYGWGCGSTNNFGGHCFYLGLACVLVGGLLCAHTLAQAPHTL